ncbi:hypothetical protein ACT21L_004659 [Vibrio vulnificus]|nr:hypothetical protein [Vibrio vulnificus]ELI3524704.1 hypothetical protein [Vibrio vulnificus]
MEIQLTALVIALLLSIVLMVGALFGLCGPTWTQRLGLCFAILSIALGVFSSDIEDGMWISLLKPYIENIVVICSLFGGVIGSFGEVIWKLIHPRGRTRAEVLKESVNS